MHSTLTQRWYYMYADVHHLWLENCAHKPQCKADQTILIIILKEQQYPSYIERYQIYAFFYCTPSPLCDWVHHNMTLYLCVHFRNNMAVCAK